MRLVLMSLAAVVLITAPALANDPAKPDEPRKVCRMQPAPTGSHRPGKRICRTEAEWNDALQNAGLPTLLTMGIVSANEGHDDDQAQFDGAQMPAARAQDAQGSEGTGRS